MQAWEVRLGEERVDLLEVRSLVRESVALAMGHQLQVGHRKAALVVPDRLQPVDQSGCARQWG